MEQPLLRSKSALAALLDFFGLKQEPFGVTPDPSCLYLSATHREALASMMYGIEAGRGFLALIANPGMGKTTLLFHLLEQFRNSARSALLFQTQCSSREFMHLLMSELGYETQGFDFVRMHEVFNQHLLREARAGKRCIIMVDEAQNLDASVLETIRLLSNFETPHAKLLQIVLAGQPELGDKLSSNRMAQLRQRLSQVNRLEPFSANETELYILHRLRIAGYGGRSLLTRDALAIATQFSIGIPRNINTFCFNALSLAFALRRTVIDLEIAQEVMRDLDSLGKRSGENAVDQRAVLIEDKAREHRPPSSAIVTAEDNRSEEVRNLGVYRQHTAAPQVLEKFSAIPQSLSGGTNGKQDGETVPLPKSMVSNLELSDENGTNSRPKDDKVIGLAEATACLNSMVRSLKTVRS